MKRLQFHRPGGKIHAACACVGRPNPGLAKAGRLGYFCAVKLISWNVNGLRAVLRKNFLDYLANEKPDILCLQETKAGPDDVEQLWPATYTTYWNTAQKKGYSGTAIFTKTRPLAIVTRASKSPSTTRKGGSSPPSMPTTI